MKIEIIDFFFLKIDRKKRHFYGTMHVFLVDHEIEIRGIFVIYKKDKFIFEMPYRKGLDIKEDKMMKYPYLRFRSEEKNNSFFNQLRSLGEEYIRKEIMTLPAENRPFIPQDIYSIPIESPKEPSVQSQIYSFLNKLC